jgi:hypothetical protein
MVWTGKEVIVWFAASYFYPISPARYNPDVDKWFPVNIKKILDGAIDIRIEAPIVWTGKALITLYGKYNPMGDTWETINKDGAPPFPEYPYPYFYCGVWTGKEIVYLSNSKEYAIYSRRYNPELDTWKPINIEGYPEIGRGFSCVWSGSEVIVWGGEKEGTKLNTGGRYDPEKDTWRSMNDEGAPEGRSGHLAVWTGSEMIIWGGSTKKGPTNTGGVYDPESDSWRLISTKCAPVAVENHRAAFSGKKMIVIGGERNCSGCCCTNNTFFPCMCEGGCYCEVVSSSGIYNPDFDTWVPIGEDKDLSDCGIVWIGQQAVIWCRSSGWKYIPE